MKIMATTPGLSKGMFFEDARSTGMASAPNFRDNINAFKRIRLAQFCKEKITHLRWSGGLFHLVSKLDTKFDPIKNVQNLNMILEIFHWWFIL